MTFLPAEPMVPLVSAQSFCLSPGHGLGEGHVGPDHISAHPTPTISLEASREFHPLLRLVAKALGFQAISNVLSCNRRWLASPCPVQANVLSPPSPAPGALSAPCVVWCGTGWFPGTSKAGTGGLSLGKGGLWPLETRIAPPSSPGVLETPSSGPVGLLPLKDLWVDQGWFFLTPCVPIPPPCCACGLDCSLSMQGTHMSWQIRSTRLSPQEHKPRATSSHLPGTLGV